MSKNVYYVDVLEREDIPDDVAYELSKPRQKSWKMSPMERAAQGRKAKMETL